MRSVRTLCPLLLAPVVAAAAWPALPAATQAPSLRTSVLTAKRELTGDLWGGGPFVAFTTDEDTRDLNGDRDMEDTVLSIMDMRNLQVQETGLAVDTVMIDEAEDRVIAVHPKGTWVAFPVSEADQGKRDLNANGTTTEGVLALYNTTTKTGVNLGVLGKNPIFLGDSLYFTQPEAAARKDLNGDNDLNDDVLCVLDVTTKKWESLGVDASGGLEAAGDWLAVLTSEAAQGAKDLNGDRDTQDLVVQLYQLSAKKWTSTGLDGSADLVMSEKMVTIGVEEANQGGKDLNNDGDAQDIVAHVWDLAAGKATSLAVDGGEGLYVEGDLLALATTEASQGNKDLNGDSDTDDAVIQVYRLGSDKVVNVGRDCTGGIAVERGKVAFAVSEEDNGKKDLNRDMDTDDFVLMVYDPVKNSVMNTLWAVDGDLTAAEGLLTWKVLEADQGNKDMNRDMDTDDSILFVMDLATNALSPTGYAASDAVHVTAQAVAFSCFEADQGERDLNMDRDAEDEILMVCRITR